MLTSQRTGTRPSENNHYSLREYFTLEWYWLPLLLPTNTKKKSSRVVVVDRARQNRLSTWLDHVSLTTSIDATQRSPNTRTPRPTTLAECLARYLRKARVSCRSSLSDHRRCIRVCTLRVNT